LHIYPPRGGTNRAPHDRDWPDKKDSGKQEDTMALEWLRDILGEAYTDELDRAIAAKIGTQYVSKTDFNAKNALAKELQTKLEAAQAAAKGAEALQAQIASLTAEKTAAEERVKQVQITAALRLALTGSVHDAALVAGLIDTDKLEISDTGEVTAGLDEQIAALRESKAFLFTENAVPQTPKPQGWKPADGAPPPAGGTKDAFAARLTEAKP
jgi:hypothetical protein